MSMISHVQCTLGWVKKTKSWLGFVACHFYGTVLCVESGFEIRLSIGCIQSTQKWLFMFTKEFQKYTKENLPAQYFGSNLSRNGLIFARSSLDCHNFSTLSIDTHLGYSNSHRAIWLYGFMAIIWRYGYIKAIKPCGFKIPL